MLVFVFASIYIFIHILKVTITMRGEGYRNIGRVEATPWKIKGGKREKDVTRREHENKNWRR